MEDYDSCKTTETHRVSGALLSCLVFVVAMFALSPVLAAEFGPLKGNVFGSGNKALVIVLHGNTSKGGPATSQDGVARRVASSFKDVTAVGIVRPGYRNDTGMRSPGNNNGRSDNWTRQNNDLLAKTIISLKERYKAKKTIVVAHSGGAAQAASVIGRYPGIVDVVILAGCPCDREQYAIAHGDPNLKFRSEWGTDYVAGIRDTKVIAVTGDRDTDVPPKIAQTYIEAARSAGIDARFILLPGVSHQMKELMRPIMKILSKQL